MVAERVLLSYSDKMAVQILRPATVCGFSPRMRLDTMVNSFTMQALEKGVIRYNGGSQMRPNIHIDDMVALYLWMLERPNLTGIYNAGFENMSVGGIATLVARILDATTDPAPSTDNRSYRLNSDKLISTGFKPTKTVQDAIFDLVRKYQLGQLKENPLWHSLASMPK
jgi:nucleoside-diphosphate-sugar epimerase